MEFRSPFIQMDNNEFLSLTDKKCVQTQIRYKVSEILAKYQADVNARRSKIRQLLNHEREMEDYELREKATVLAQQQKESKWRELEALRTRRREQELKLRKEKISQLDLENSHERRIQESKAFLFETKNAQFRQIRENHVKRANQANENNYWSDLNYHQKIERDQKQMEKDRYEDQVKVENRRTWTEQMNDMSYRRQNERVQWRTEEDRLNSQIVKAEENLERLAIQRERCKKQQQKVMLENQIEDIHHKKMKEILEKRLEDKMFNEKVANDLNYEKEFAKKLKNEDKFTTDSYIKYVRQLHSESLMEKELREKEERERERPAIEWKIQKNKPIWNRNRNR